MAVMNIGAPACGVNAAVRSFVRVGLTCGATMYTICGGMDGLVKGDFKKMEWSDVQGWCGRGGSLISTTRTLIDKVGADKVAVQLKKFNIHGLLIIGGFEAFQCGLSMAEKREQFPEFCIPIVVLPATISNNVPGSEFSLGADTALNEIANICDRIKQSATGTRRRVFIVETMGGYCGYLATLSALAGGADQAYIFEEKFGMSDLQGDVAHLKAKIEDGVQRGLILRNEKANENYTTDFIHQLFSEEGKGVFVCRKNILGHMQQGGTPSPFDRNLGTKFAAKAAENIMANIKQYKQPNGSVCCKTPETATLLGLVKKQTKFSPLTELKSQTDFQRRLPLDNWWLKLRPLMRILAKHDSIYEIEGIQVTNVDSETSDSDQS